jgi:hypothetical protein
METLAGKTTQIRVGTSSHRDFFQRGREAAQMAKTQPSNDAPGLILAFSNAGVHFKDFIEGVRLVVGDAPLIGLPCEPWLAQDVPNYETGAVVIVSSQTNHFWVAPHRTSIHHVETGTTHLAGNAHLGKSKGLLVFGEETVIANETFQHALIADMNPNMWEVGAGWTFKSNNFIACQNQFLNHGVAAVGINSQEPWLISSVGLSSFRSQPQFIEEGVKTTLRSALQQKNATDFAFALLLLNGFEDLDPIFTHRQISHAMSLHSHVPWLGLNIDAHFVHNNDRWQPTNSESLTTLLVPA